MVLERARRKKKALPLQGNVCYILNSLVSIASFGKWGVIISIFLAFSFTFANGEERRTPQIKEMQVALWPEYDDPRVLVMYRGSFGEGAPSRVTFLVPKGVEINQACSLTAKEEHLCQMYDSEEKGNYLQVSYNLPEPRFLLEFYMPLIVNEANKAARLTFSSLYPVRELTLEALKPLRAENFRAVPETTLSHKDEQGLEYSAFKAGELKAGKKVEFKVEYKKADSRPSVAKRTGSGGASLIGPARSGWFLTVSVALLSAAVLLFVGYLAAVRRRRAVVPSSPAPAAREAEFRPRFCFKCGVRLMDEAKFCSGCGVGLKKLKE